METENIEIYTQMYTEAKTLTDLYRILSFFRNDFALFRFVWKPEFVAVPQKFGSVFDP